MRIETTVDIDAPVARVWDVTVDVERWPEWTASMRRVERLDDGPFAVGSRVRVRQPLAPRADWVVTAMTPGTAFTWESHVPGARSVGTHELTPRPDGGTSVRLAFEASGPVARLLWPLIGGTARRYVETEAAGLKRRCETTASAGAERGPTVG